MGDGSRIPAGDRSLVPAAAAPLLPGLSQHVGHLLWRARSVVQAALGEVLPEGVDLPGYAALLTLADGLPRSQQELADAASTSRTTMVGLAERLVRAGLVTRERNPRDRRSYLLTRTPAGAAAAAAWRAHVAALEEHLTAGFDTAERAELRDLLRAALGEDLGPGAPEELSRSTGFLVLRVSLRLHGSFAAALQPLGIEPRHFGALSALLEMGPSPQSAVARALGVSGPTVVQVVDELEALGLVRRERDAADRRTSVLHPTDRTADVAARATRIARREAARDLVAVGPAGIDRLAGLLRRFVLAAA